jgi:DNA-binding SARP family transcriptional activator
MRFLARSVRVAVQGLRATLALILLVGIVVGIPWYLAAALGWPWPRPLPASIDAVGPWLAVWRIDRTHFVLDLLGIVGWSYWLAFVRQLAVQLPGAVADAARAARNLAPVGSVRRAGPAASVVALLLATVALSLMSARTPASAASAPPPPTRGTVATAGQADYHVGTGDDLWDIAKQKLRNPLRWREIYDLNRAKVQADGQALVDPSLIQPGWILDLPTPGAVADGPITSETSGTPKTAPPPIAEPQLNVGVTGVSASQQSPSTVAQTVPRTDTAHERQLARPRAHRDRSFMNLPGGGVVGIGLVGALAAAIALARKRRRIRTVARWPIPMDTPRSAVPEPIAEIERAHLATLAPPALGYFQDGDLDNEDDDPYLSGLDRFGSERPDVQVPQPASSVPEVPSRGGLNGPSIPASYADFTAPGSLSFGTDGDREVGLALRDCAGLGLTGPGMAGAARALLVGMLASGGPLASLDHMRVLIPSADLETLLSDTCPSLPRLEVTADLDDAVDMVEAEYLDRRRLVSDLGVRTAADVRRFYPEQTLEPLVLIATPESAIAPRLTALLDVGRSVDVHAVLLGPWHSGATVEINDDRRTRSEDTQLDGLLAFSLSESEAMALLTQLDPSAQETDQEATIRESAEAPVLHLAAVPAQPSPVATLPLVPRVLVNVLGPVTVAVDGHEVVLNNKETSILTFLALHPSGISRDAIIAALWTNPDGTNNGSAETFRSTVYNARTRIRTATGEAQKMYITNRSSRYLLDPADIATDLARFVTHLETANRTRDEAERIASLEAAVDTYRGQLADGIHADWLIVDREAESRRFGDACARLADLTVETRPEFALHVLERAVADADCNQELYAKIMEVQARLGRHTEVWKTLRLLEVRLAVLDDEPDRNLYELADRLTNQWADRIG